MNGFFEGPLINMKSSQQLALLVIKSIKHNMVWD